MRGYSDHTSEMAIGAANKEWQQMAKLALKLRSGNCKSSWAMEQEAKFIGIYKRLLDDPIEEVQKEAWR